MEHWISSGWRNQHEKYFYKQSHLLGLLSLAVIRLFCPYGDQTLWSLQTFFFVSGFHLHCNNLCFTSQTFSVKTESLWLMEKSGNIYQKDRRPSFVIPERKKDPNIFKWLTTSSSILDQDFWIPNILLNHEREQRLFLFIYLSIIHSIHSIGTLVV